MKTSRTIVLSVLFLAGAAIAKDSPIAARSAATATGASAAAAVSAAVSAATATAAADPGPYSVSLAVTESGDHSTWRYTMTKNTDNGDPGDLENFVLNLANCGDQSPKMANIVSATVNGVDWMDHIEASDTDTGCTITSDNFVKFDNLPSADTYVIEFTLNDVFPEMDTTGWLRSSTLCLSKAMTGPGCKGYVRTTAMDADVSVLFMSYSDINTFMHTFGYDYTENPNCTGGFGGDINGVHASGDVDSFFSKVVFRFDIHIDPIIDGDRCSSTTVDRQRDEMKSITDNSTWAKVQGNWDEWQILEWKFRIPAGFQPTSNFTHIHQLKAQDGPNNGSPLITITPRANSDGSNRRIQIIHSVDGANTGKGTIVDNIPLSAFEDQWVQVREEVHYNHAGSYSCKITRVSDGQVLIDFTDPNIDMWRIGSSYIRNKYGIYRSLAGGKLNQNPVGQSPLLKNEHLWLTDFRIYEKNTNPNPTVPHN